MKKKMRKAAVLFSLTAALLCVMTGCKNEERDVQDNESEVQKQTQVQGVGQLPTEVWEQDAAAGKETLQSVGETHDRIPEAVLADKRKNTKIYGADFDRDGTEEYLITYQAGNSDAIYAAVVYDAQTDRQISVFAGTDDNLTLTETQKRQMEAVIDNWYAADFGKSRGISKEDFLQYHITGLSCYPVKNGDEMMLHVSYVLAEQQNQHFLKDDRVELLLRWDGEEYAVSQCWYKAKYKSISFLK